MRRFAHKEADALTHEQRAYNRLKQRKQDQPYYQRYYTFYLLVIGIGWIANLLSGITESSKIYVFYHAFLKSFAFAEVATWFSVIASVAMIELFHRVVASSYFKDLVENDTHKREMTPKLILMLVMAILSAGLSFSGGFDLVRLAKEAPKSVAAQLLSPTDINAAYSPLIHDMQHDIADFRKTREWKGRLSDQSARLWEDMKINKQSLQLKQAEALTNLSSANQQEQLRVDSLNQHQQQQYTSQVNQRGYGLGFVSIFALFVLYACLWYDEEYQERKAIYLEKKFGAMTGEPVPPPLPAQSRPFGAASYQPIPPSEPYMSTPGTEPPSSSFHSPIGYFTTTQKSNIEGSLTTENIPSVQTCPDVDRDSHSLVDRYTIPHHYTKGGKQVTVHYSLRMVNSRIKQYEREVEEAQRKQMTQDILTNRMQWLLYWQGKQQALLAKMKE